MKRHSLAITLMFSALLLGITGCDEGTNDWSSSAKISGYVLESVNDPTGVPGVRVIIESDIDSDVPYQGPDRWFETDQNGYFEGYIFLGLDDEVPNEYVYVADLLASYWTPSNQTFSWGGGITVGPGSHFTLPTVYLDMFGN